MSEDTTSSNYYPNNEEGLPTLRPIVPEEISSVEEPEIPTYSEEKEVKKEIIDLCAAFPIYKN